MEELFWDPSPLSVSQENNTVSVWLTVDKTALIKNTETSHNFSLIMASYKLHFPYSYIHIFPHLRTLPNLCFYLFWWDTCKNYIQIQRWIFGRKLHTHLSSIQSTQKFSCISHTKMNGNSHSLQHSPSKKTSQWTAPEITKKNCWNKE